MGRLIELKIDVTKISKKKLYAGKDGAKYLTMTVSVNDEVDKYGNDIASYEAQTEDERKAQATRNYLGNGKTFWANDGKTAAEKSGKTGEASAFKAPDDDDDDLPF